MTQRTEQHDSYLALERGGFVVADNLPSILTEGVYAPQDLIDRLFREAGQLTLETNRGFGLHQQTQFTTQEGQTVSFAKGVSREGQQVVNRLINQISTEFGPQVAWDNLREQITSCAQNLNQNERHLLPVLKQLSIECELGQYLLGHGETLTAEQVTTNLGTYFTFYNGRFIGQGKSHRLKMTHEGKQFSQAALNWVNRLYPELTQEQCLTLCQTQLVQTVETRLLRKSLVGKVKRQTFGIVRSRCSLGENFSTSPAYAGVARRINYDDLAERTIILGKENVQPSVSTLETVLNRFGAELDAETTWLLSTGRQVGEDVVAAATDTWRRLTTYLGSRQFKEEDFPKGLATVTHGALAGTLAGLAVGGAAYLVNRATLPESALAAEPPTATWQVPADFNQPEVTIVIPSVDQSSEVQVSPGPAEMAPASAQEEMGQPETSPETAAVPEVKPTPTLENGKKLSVTAGGITHNLTVREEVSTDPKNIEGLDGLVWNFYPLNRGGYYSLFLVHWGKVDGKVLPGTDIAQALNTNQEVTFTIDGQAYQFTPFAKPVVLPDEMFEQLTYEKFASQAQADGYDLQPTKMAVSLVTCGWNAQTKEFDSRVIYRGYLVEK